MERTVFQDIVAEAMLAPSTHNTQPVRWSLEGDTIRIFADLSCRLPVGDPMDRDLYVSCGAAIEGTVLALAKKGIGAHVTLADAADKDGYRAIGAVEPKGKPIARDVEVCHLVHSRTTHRAGFAQAPKNSLHNWSEEHVTLVTSKADIAWLAKQTDIASAQIMNDPAFRKELLDWLRLNKNAKRFGLDGLNAQALAMPAVVASLTPLILSTGLYNMLSKIGLGPALSGEAARTRESSAIVLLHWPKKGSMIEAGRAFYKTWLYATKRDLVAWPAASLADDPATYQRVSTRFGIPQERQLFNALRLGKAQGITAPRARVSVSDVIL